MAHFFELPREMRDMIYMAIITWERPRLTVADTQSAYGWNRASSGSHGTDGECVTSSKGAPETCSSVLASCRRVHEELTQTIERARRKDMIFARIDCIVKDGEQHYFSWLSLPIVQTTKASNHDRNQRGMSGWVPRVAVVGRLLAVPRRKQLGSMAAVATIEQLQMDVRYAEQEGKGQGRVRTAGHGTSWAVCEALTRLLDRGPGHALAVDTLTLNVSRPCVQGPAEGAVAAADDARATAQDLVGVWNKLWAGDDVRARQYQELLHRIKRVRVCIDGVLVRERELGSELARGQAERRRIAQRVGW